MPKNQGEGGGSHALLQRGAPPMEANTFSHRGQQVDRLMGLMSPAKQRNLVPDRWQVSPSEQDIG